MGSELLPPPGAAPPGAAPPGDAPPLAGDVGTGGDDPAVEAGGGTPTAGELETRGPVAAGGDDTGAVITTGPGVGQMEHETVVTVNPCGM